MRSLASVRASARAARDSALKDPAGRVVRAVDQDHPGARRDRSRDAVDVEVERRRIEPNPDGLAARDEDQQLVEEPRRGEEHDFVTRANERAEGHGDRREAAVRHRHVGGVPIEPGSRAERLCDRSLRRRLRELVREPVLVLRDEMVLERVHVARERHLLRIADREVRDVGFGVEPGELAPEEGEERGDALAHPLGGWGGGRHR